MDFRLHKYINENNGVNIIKYIKYNGDVIYNEELYDIISIINLLPISNDNKETYIKMLITAELQNLKIGLTFNYNKYILNYIGNSYNIDIDGYSKLYYLSDSIYYINCI